MSLRDDMITLVIHTPERAGILKNILEQHGMEVYLEDFVVSKSTLRVAERVKINQEDLPLALKILESGDNYSAASIAMKMAGMSGNLLIPVDFSDGSFNAIKVGFSLAKRLSIHPVVMHTFMAPLFTSGGTSFFESKEKSVSNSAENEVTTIRLEAGKRLASFKEKIRRNQLEGEITDVKFSTLLMEGVAEEVILNYCKSNPPMLVVMSTRGKRKKEEDLIGSVTAEVLDSCRVPVLTVPRDCKLPHLEEIRHLLMFCNIDQHDVLAMDSLMRMLDYPKFDVTLVPVSGSAKSSTKDKIASMGKFFNENYSSSKFKVSIPIDSSFREHVDNVIREEETNLLIVPNKKTNIFSRIFHPTIAHKFLFERDMPMLVIPV